MCPLSDDRRVGWFLRVIELADGSWACRRGLAELDRHHVLQDAVAHVTTLGSRESHAELFLHRVDGTVERMGTVGREPRTQRSSA
jgi:hypothetical protein